VQQAKVAGQADTGGRVLAGTELEDVKCTGEDEGELQRGANGVEGVGGGVVGREDGGVERVVLKPVREALAMKRKGEREESLLTFRPITPRHAIEGIVVAISTVES
jgi:hypothetical protein